MSIARMKELGSFITTSQSVAPQLCAAGTFNGTGVDRMPSGDQEYLSGIVAVSIGATAGTPTSFTVDVSIQDSADNSTFAAVAAGFGGPIAITQAVAASQMVTAKFNANGLRRYVRAVAVVAFVGGTSPTIALAVDITLGGVAKAPTP